jgi:hypothetical protein
VFVEASGEAPADAYLERDGAWLPLTVARPLAAPGPPAGPLPVDDAVARTIEAVEATVAAVDRTAQAAAPYAAAFARVAGAGPLDRAPAAAELEGLRAALGEAPSPAELETLRAEFDRWRANRPPPFDLAPPAAELEKLRAELLDGWRANMPPPPFDL